MKINRVEAEKPSDVNKKNPHPHFSVKKIGASILVVLSTLFPVDGKGPIKPIKKGDKIVKTQTQTQKSVNGLDKITIHPNKEIELKRYRSYRDASDLALKKKNQLIKKYPSLMQDIDPIESRQMFTLAVKESRLVFAKPNESGAFGFSGLKPIAIRHVDHILEKNGIKIWSKDGKKLNRRFDPYKNQADHILYMHLYFGSQQKELLNKVPRLPKKDRFRFTVAGYNAGISRIAQLLKATNYPSSWDQFVKIGNKQFLKISKKPVIVAEKSYGTKNYKDRFGGKDYTGNKKIVVGGVFPTTLGKRYEIIRYVEMNRAIKETLK